jgi:hypothetical protein
MHIRRRRHRDAIGLPLPILPIAAMFFPRLIRGVIAELRRKFR